MKVLIVDDSLTIRTAIRQILQSEGFDVHEAKDGYEALKRIKEGDKFDAILLDWEMPTMDGYITLSTVRQQELAPETKIFMLTSLNEKKHIVKAIAAGADGYIVKPFTPDTILEKLATS